MLWWTNPLRTALTQGRLLRPPRIPASAERTEVGMGTERYPAEENPLSNGLS
jgi:hypothetical protein